MPARIYPDSFQRDKVILCRVYTWLIPLCVAVALLITPLPGSAQGFPDSDGSGSLASRSLSDQVARADSALFDALFARCDADRAGRLLADDVEFYDDRTGRSAGDDLREDFRRLTENCPASNGVRRILISESVQVHPIEGYGAVQMGEHHFVERGAATSTVARFVHVWKRAGDGWELARIISLHEVVDAARAAELRQ
jgi:ketosteroid isomerase-like protein